MSARIDTFYRPPFIVDVDRTVARHRRGLGDPTVRCENRVWWRAVRTPEGVGTIAMRSQSGGVRASAWGAGGEWLIAQLPAFFGAFDDDTGFNARIHPLISAVHERHRSVRIGRSDVLTDPLMSAILEQKVTTRQAFRARRALTLWHGERAPGPRQLWVAPSWQRWRLIPSWDWHRAGVEPPQSRTAVRAAASGAALERTLSKATDGRQREEVLCGLAGVGVWTAAEVRVRSYGDPDAVSFGDFHLAHQVGFALTGQRVDDDGMRELLEPWAGHRQRVIQLIFLSGVVEPRRAARMHIEDHRGR